MKKKILTLCLLLLVAFCFANTNPRANNIEKNVVYKNEKNDKLGCKVSCYAIVTNTDTGESQILYAEATAELCGVAKLLCQTDALRKAYNYIESKPQ